MPEPADDRAWRALLKPYVEEFGVEPSGGGALRLPFDEAMCAAVEELKPDLVSFHFGLPDDRLLARVKAAGAIILSSATTVDEARWLAERGVDAVIAQGFEAGGHTGRFLGSDPAEAMGLFALLPQIADAVAVPVVAAGGIADGRGIAAAFALGASAVQLGTAYLHTPEAEISDAHRAGLQARPDAVHQSDDRRAGPWASRPSRRRSRRNPRGSSALPAGERGPGADPQGCRATGRVWIRPAVGRASRAAW